MHAERGPVTVLVVEDEALVRMNIADQLKEAGYSVLEASSARGAVSILRDRPDIKLVVSDVRVPGPVDGLELSRFVRSRYPGTKVVLVSAYPKAEDWVEHDGFFRKPYTGAQIIKHLRSLTG